MPAGAQDKSADEIEHMLVRAEPFFRSLYQTFLEMKDLMLHTRALRPPAGTVDAAREAWEDGFLTCAASASVSPRLLSLSCSRRCGVAGPDRAASCLSRPPPFLLLRTPLTTPLQPPLSRRNFTRQIELYGTIITVLSIARQNAARSKAGLRAYLDIVTVAADHFMNFTVPLGASLLCRSDWVRAHAEAAPLRPLPACRRFACEVVDRLNSPRLPRSPALIIRWSSLPPRAPPPPLCPRRPRPPAPAAHPRSGARAGTLRRLRRPPWTLLAWRSWAGRFTSTAQLRTMTTLARCFSPLASARALPAS